MNIQKLARKDILGWVTGNTYITYDDDHLKHLQKMYLIKRERAIVSLDIAESALAQIYAFSLHTIEERREIIRQWKEEENDKPKTKS